MKPKKKLQQIVTMEIYILLWLEDFPFIGKLERPFANPEDAISILKEMRLEIIKAIEQRSRVIGYPLSTIDEEEQGLARWDTLLYNGSITQRTYDYSMTSPDLLCIMHWNCTDQKFECACAELGVKFHR